MLLHTLTHTHNFFLQLCLARFKSKAKKLPDFVLGTCMVSIAS